MSAAPLALSLRIYTVNHRFCSIQRVCKLLMYRSQVFFFSQAFYAPFFPFKHLCRVPYIDTTVFIFSPLRGPCKLALNTRLADGAEAHQKPSHITCGYLPPGSSTGTREYRVLNNNTQRVNGAQMLLLPHLSSPPPASWQFPCHDM